ncbi:hypothetical protein [Marinoscillum sp. MHG1-6]|uniref:hypothetical protein n=1 Tax=Marinoscillum sp. MHG1-6 TaxID=2959627 RepID=UPI002157B395|nr:hypothetical protein [Marinoscillum sp. MHG1-6]
MLLIIIACFPLLSYGQFNFEPDSADSSFPFERFKETELRRPNSDSIFFELRYWVNSDFGGFVQLTFNNNSTWNYRRAYLSEGIIQTMALTSNQPKIDSLWSKLLANDVLELPNQDEIIYTYQKDGRTIKLGPEKEETERLVHSTLDASGYTIELFTKGKYRSYYYYNPITLNEHFRKSGWTSPETEKFANIVNILTDAFDLNEVFKANLKEKMGKE